MTIHAFPECVPEPEAAEHLRLLSILIQAIADTPADPLRVDGLPHDALAVPITLAIDHARSLRFLLHATRLASETTKFGDHDQLASALLYWIQRFDRLRSASGARSPRRVWRGIQEVWGEIDAEAVAAVQRGPCGGLIANVEVTEPAHFGIVTALEHEYQSVLRRMDEVAWCTDDLSCGFAILDRSRYSDDPKTIVSNRARTSGLAWARGRIGRSRVLVTCTGQAGREAVRRCLREMRAQFGEPLVGWLVVGVCAGTDSTWPIGTVLLAANRIFDLVVTHADGNKWKLGPPIVPLSVRVKTQQIKLTRCYRQLPTRVTGVTVAPTNGIPVKTVRFASVNVVMNVKRISNAARNWLLRQKVLAKQEHIGIEMEAAGIESSRVGIVKAVCDYGDERKSQWSEGTKAEYQLFAAETAADVAAQAIREHRVGPVNRKRSQRFAR